ncbi:MAG TPA: hypothetical protein VLI54_03580 [Bacillota bacterium]|nr:hypothetical protein [Bacillota bacterium]
MPDHIQEVLKLLIEATGIKHIERIGARGAVFYPQDGNYSQLVSKFAKVFHGKYEELAELSADKARDVFFGLDGIKNGYNNHIEFGPAKNHEVASIFTATGPSNKSESNIIIDVDVFMQSPEISELEENISPLITEGKRLIDGCTALIEKNL